MKKKYYIVGISALLWVILDQVTKLFFQNLLLVSESPRITDRIDVIDGFFGFALHYNDGAAWGILSGNMVVFYIITLIAFGFFYYLMKEVDFTNKRLFSIGVILVIGGAIGNFIDRIFYQEVIDFIDFIIFGYDFPTFNIADIGLVVGTIIIAFDIIWEDVIHGKIKNNGDAE